MTRILKNFKKMWRFVDQNLNGKLNFAQFLTKYFFEFWLLSERISRGRITPSTTTIFPISGGLSGVPPLNATEVGREVTICDRRKP